jgi:hypothetical protein
MKTTKFVKNLLCLTLVIFTASMQIACSRDNDNNNANAAFNNGQCFNQQFGQQQFQNQQFQNQQFGQQQFQNQQFLNQNCGGFGGNGFNGGVIQQQCFGNYSTPQGQFGFCQGFNCAGFLLYDQFGQPVQCI